MVPPAAEGVEWLGAGSVWSALTLVDADPPAGWSAPDFEPEAWTRGRAPFYVWGARDGRVHARLTVDNHYALYAGAPDGRGLRRLSGNTEVDWLPVEALEADLEPGEHLYVAGWEPPQDTDSAQMFVAEVTLPDGRQILTTPDVWGALLGPEGANPALTDEEAPSAARLTQMVTDGGWARPAGVAELGGLPWGDRLLGVFDGQPQLIWIDTLEGASRTNTSETFALFGTWAPVVAPAGRTRLAYGAETLFRATFDHEGAVGAWTPELDLWVDDGAVVYLNGREVSRVNAPVDAWPAAQPGEPAWLRGIALPTDALRPGRNVIAVAVRQADDAEADLRFDARLRGVPSVGAGGDAGGTVDAGSLPADAAPPLDAGPWPDAAPPPMCLEARAPCADDAACCGDLLCGQTTLGQVCCGGDGAACATVNGEDCCGDRLCLDGRCVAPPACLPAREACEGDAQCCGDLLCGQTTLGQVCCGGEGAACATVNGEDCCGDRLCLDGRCVSPGNAVPVFKAPLPCGQSWTYSHHDQEVRLALDFINNNGATDRAPTVASAGGIAYQRNEPNGAGLYIVIDHGAGWTTYHFHLSAFLVGDGARVTRGEPIGLVGNTGNSFGAHLHYEQLHNAVGQVIHINGVSLAPYPGVYGQRSLVSDNCP